MLPCWVSSWPNPRQHYYWTVTVGPFVLVKRI